MSSLILPRRFYTQPAGFVGIDRQNTLARNLELCVSLAQRDLTDAISGKQLIETGHLQPQVTPIGIYSGFASGKYLDFIIPPALTTSTQMTFAWSECAAGTNAYSTIANINFGSGTNSFAIFRSVSDLNYYFVVGPRGNGGSTGITAIFNSSPGQVVNGAMNRFVLVVNDTVLSRVGTGYTLFFNGVRIAGTTGIPSNQFGSHTGSVARIGALDGGSDPWEGAIGDFRIWSRALSDAEAEIESRNPWQLYRASE